MERIEYSCGKRAGTRASATNPVIACSLRICWTVAHVGKVLGAQMEKITMSRIPHINCADVLEGHPREATSAPAGVSDSVVAGAASCPL